MATSTYAELGDDLGQDGCGVVEDATVGGCCVLACVVAIGVPLLGSACKLSSKEGRGSLVHNHRDTEGRVLSDRSGGSWWCA